MTIEVARVIPGDRQALQYIDHLSRIESYCVGFLPLQAYEQAIDKGRVLLLFDNNQCAGYCIHGPTLPLSKLYQVVVQADCRRIEHGTALVDAAVAHFNEGEAEAVSLHCAEDLEANAFWRAIGFQLRGMRTKSRTLRRWQYRYERTLPGATIHRLREAEIVKAHGLEKLDALLRTGKVQLADMLLRRESQGKKPNPRK